MTSVLPPPESLPSEPEILPTGTEKRLLTALIRLASLGTKFFLTLYMGRFFSLEDLGTYGLVLGVAMFMNAVFGVRLDFVISREMVGATPLIAARRIRDQIVFYSFNYLIFAAAMLVFFACGGAGVSPAILAYILVIAIVENLGGVLTENMIALRQPLLSNFLVFVRMGLWTLPVVACGFWDASYRNVLFLLNAWALGAGASLVITGWVWRHFPWREVWAQPVAWDEIRRALRVTAPIWVGGMAGVAATYVDRFIVSSLLGMDHAGIMTFYASFSLTLLTLMQSGVFAFSYPQMIHAYKLGDHHGFVQEVRRTSVQVFVFAGVLAVLLAGAVPLLGALLGKAAFVAQVPTLWMLLLGAWVRANASTLSYILYARHQDRAIWVGDLLSLLPVVVGNFVLIPVLGLEGVGVSGLLSAVFLILWRSWHVRGYVQK